MCHYVPTISLAELRENGTENPFSTIGHRKCRMIECLKVSETSNYLIPIFTWPAKPTLLAIR